MQFFKLLSVPNRQFPSQQFGGGKQYLCGTEKLNCYKMSKTEQKDGEFSLSSLYSVQGLVCVVTGGGSGIGACNQGTLKLAEGG